MINKHKIIQEYLSNAMTKFLHFNSATEEENHTRLTPIFSESQVKIYTSGDTIKNYDFAITIIKPYDQGTNAIDIESVFDVQGFIKWVNLQNEARNFPNFGEHCTVIRIENLQDMTHLSDTNEEQTQFKYMFACKVIYLQERGE